MSKRHRPPVPNMAQISSAKERQILSEHGFSPTDDVHKYYRANSLGFLRAGVADMPPIELAHIVMKTAAKEPLRKKRLELAQHAFNISPDCPDAYITLAQDEAETVLEKNEIFGKAIEVSRGRLSETTTQGGSLRFWLLEAYPYIRALTGYANTLEEAGQLDLAVEQWLELLRFDPSDDQKVRYYVIPLLIDNERWEEAETLLGKFEDDSSVHIVYSRALCAYKKFGDNDVAAEALYPTLGQNPYVVGFLTGARQPPKKNSGAVMDSEVQQAFKYFSRAGHIWKKTPGAIEWMKRLHELNTKH